MSPARGEAPWCADVDGVPRTRATARRRLPDVPQCRCRRHGCPPSGPAPCRRGTQLHRAHVTERDPKLRSPSPADSDGDAMDDRHRRRAGSRWAGRPSAHRGERRSRHRRAVVAARRRGPAADRAHRGGRRRRGRRRRRSSSPTPPRRRPTCWCGRPGPRGPAPSSAGRCRTTRASPCASPSQFAPSRRVGRGVGGRPTPTRCVVRGSSWSPAPRRSTRGGRPARPFARRRWRWWSSPRRAVGRPDAGADARPAGDRRRELDPVTVGGRCGRPNWSASPTAPATRCWRRGTAARGAGRA